MPWGGKKISPSLFPTKHFFHCAPTKTCTCYVGLCDHYKMPPVFLQDHLCPTVIELRYDWKQTLFGVKEMAVQEKYQFLTAQQVPSQYSLTEPEYSTETVTLWKKSVLSYMTLNRKGIVFSSLPDSLVLSAVHFILISAAVVIQRWRPFSVRVVTSFPSSKLNLKHSVNP